MSRMARSILPYLVAFELIPGLPYPHINTEHWLFLQIRVGKAFLALTSFVEESSIINRCLHCSYLATPTLFQRIPACMVPLFIGLQILRTVWLSTCSVLRRMHENTSFAIFMVVLLMCLT